MNLWLVMRLAGEIAVVFPVLGTMPDCLTFAVTEQFKAEQRGSWAVNFRCEESEHPPRLQRIAPPPPSGD